MQDVQQLVVSHMQVESGGVPGVALKRQNACNCKKSRCLKLYCECFSAGRYCKHCNCHNCSNNAEHESERLDAVNAALRRNSTAFRDKLVQLQQNAAGGGGWAAAQ